ncbi:hypothetical protein [Endozoicomonas sp. SESOKO1]|uniref:hypothetical protein n=1 Tax=Endozoicomonas sp. SESOKO1 TaxID=2828742 RepID=UPI002147C234|nr:hypothetical protein [Endozoicomonas sp. SESOKO1]
MSSTAEFLFSIIKVKYYTLILNSINIFLTLRIMSFYLLEIVTACGQSFVFGNYGPYIYDNLFEAEDDLLDSDEEAVVEVSLQLNGEITTAWHDWNFFQSILVANGFSEVGYKNYVKSFLDQWH